MINVAPREKLSTELSYVRLHLLRQDWGAAAKALENAWMYCHALRGQGDPCATMPVETILEKYRPGLRPARRCQRALTEASIGARQSDFSRCLADIETAAGYIITSYRKARS